MPPKKFIFRLQTVLEVKERQEEEEKRKLADLMAWQKEDERILAAMKQKEAETKQRLKDKQQAGEWIEVEELKRISYFLKKVAGDIVAQNNKLMEIARRIEEQREVLIKAAQERKTLEMLKEQHYHEYITEVEEEERKLLDELATLKYAREGYGGDEAVTSDKRDENW
jgi:flagellar FliJ protein